MHPSSSPAAASSTIASDASNLEPSAVDLVRQLRATLDAAFAGLASAPASACAEPSAASRSSAPHPLSDFHPLTGSGAGLQREGHATRLRETCARLTSVLGAYEGMLARASVSSGGGGSRGVSRSVSTGSLGGGGAAASSARELEERTLKRFLVNLADSRKALLSKKSLEQSVRHAHTLLADHVQETEARHADLMEVHEVADALKRVAKSLQLEVEVKVEELQTVVSLFSTGTVSCMELEARLSHRRKELERVQISFGVGDVVREDHEAAADVARLIRARRFDLLQQQLFQLRTTEQVFDAFPQRNLIEWAPQVQALFKTMIDEGRALEQHAAVHGPILTYYRREFTGRHALPEPAGEGELGMYGVEREGEFRVHFAGPRTVSRAPEHPLVTYMFVLDPPVPLGYATATKLAQFCVHEQYADADVDVEMSDALASAGSGAQQLYVDETASKMGGNLLCLLLATRAPDVDEPSDTSPAEFQRMQVPLSVSTDMASCSSIVDATTASQHRYEVMPCAGLRQRGILATALRLADPGDLSAVLELLKSSLVFNHLLETCFKRKSAMYFADDSGSEQAQLNYSFELTGEPPHVLSLLACHPTTFELFDTLIRVPDGSFSSVQVEVKLANQEPDAALSDYATKVLRKSRSVPATMHLLMQRLRG